MIDYDKLPIVFYAMGSFSFGNKQEETVAI